MAGRLTAATVRGLTQPGRYPDGDTLYLVVAPRGTKAWVQRLVIHGKRHDIGLGSASLVTLKEARERAFSNRKLARDGGDPLARKRRAKTPTFAAAAVKTFEANRARWRSDKSAANWLRSLEKHVYPALGGVPVNEITRQDVIAALSPLAGTPTAGKVRQRVRAVLAWAEASGIVDRNVADAGINAAMPAAMPVTHRRALPFPEVPAALRAIESGGASLPVKACLRFVALTACRSGEARGATWAEIDPEAREWRIAASRMKMGTEHRVPLSGAALAVLKRVQPLRGPADLLFPSPLKSTRPLGNGTLRAAMQDARIDAVPHGFRTSFRTWASERTDADHVVMELCLAHQVGSAVERAYSRSDLLAKRRRLMDEWAVYLSN